MYVYCIYIYVYDTHCRRCTHGVYAADPYRMEHMVQKTPVHLEVRPCGGATTQEGGPSVEEVRRHTGAARFLPDLLLSL